MKHGNRNAQGAQTENGFTLLETAAATMIMMVGLMAVMQLFTLSMVYNKSSTQTTMAATVAKRQMERLLAMPLDAASLAFGGALGDTNKLTGYFENYYVDFDRNGQKGSMRLSTTPFFTGQPISYIVTWTVQQDSVTVLDPVTNTQVPALPSLRRITVRAEATQAGLRGGGIAGADGATTTPAAESAQISTMRTPYI
jgi:Tfp pilus assembly protein PilV